jgi:hypothetical protein
MSGSGREVPPLAVDRLAGALTACRAALPILEDLCGGKPVGYSETGAVSEARDLLRAAVADPPAAYDLPPAPILLPVGEGPRRVVFVVGEEEAAFYVAVFSPLPGQVNAYAVVIEELPGGQTLRAEWWPKLAGQVNFAGREAAGEVVWLEHCFPTPYDDRWARVFLCWNGDGYEFARPEKVNQGAVMPMSHKAVEHVLGRTSGVRI